MIEIKNVNFRVKTENGSRNILKDINLTFSSGESVAFMGPNGSGKTTLVRCLNGLHFPTSGEIVVDGIMVTETADLFAIRRKVGIIFQNPENQIVSSTVEREIAFGLENLGVPYEEMVRIVDEMLNRFNLQKYRMHPPYLLSGGEKQRLAIAAVMAMQPQYLILDEPTSLLDPVMRDHILNMIRNFHLSSKKVDSRLTTILITQFPEEALIADRLVVFNHGEIIMDGSPQELFRRIKDFKQLGLDVPVEYRIEEILMKKNWGRTNIDKLLNCNDLKI